MDGGQGLFTTENVIIMYYCIRNYVRGEFFINVGYGFGIPYQWTGSKTLLNMSLKSSKWQRILINEFLWFKKINILTF